MFFRPLQASRHTGGKIRTLEQAILGGHHTVALIGIKTGYRSAALQLHRVLGFIAIAHGIGRCQHALHLQIQVANPLKSIIDPLLLKAQFLRIIHRAKGTAAALGGHRAVALHPMRRWLQHLLQPGNSIVLFGFNDMRRNHITGHTAAHKHRHAVLAPDGATLGSQGGYIQLNLIILFELHPNHRPLS